LYRFVAADLARARTQKVGNTLIQSLQSLTTRACTRIYQGSRKQEWYAITGFYRHGFPAVVQQTFPLVIATTMFIFGALVAWWYASQDPGFMSLIVPERKIDFPGAR
jgi:hypothetical protein